MPMLWALCRVVVQWTEKNGSGATSCGSSAPVLACAVSAGQPSSGCGVGVPEPPSSVVFLPLAGLS